MSGLSKTNDIWRATACVYAGYELVSVEDFVGHSSEFTVACPACDFEILCNDFDSGNLALADAKEFVASFHQIVAAQKAMRKQGETVWTSSRWINGEIG